MREFPIYHQKDSMDCGITCLRMVAAYYGAKYTERYLSAICPSTAEGVSLLGIDQAAHEIGLDTFCVKAATMSLEGRLPCILHWNQNHFVVLYRVEGGKKFFVADPAKGRIVYSTDDFEKHWISMESKEGKRGVAMFLKPGCDFRMNKDSSDVSRRSIRFLLNYARPFRKHFFGIVCGLMIGCVLQFLLPFLTQSVVDVGIKKHDIGFVWIVLIGELMIVIGRTATDFIRRRFLLHISMRINISLISDFFLKLLKLPMSFFDTKLTGDLLQRIADYGRVQAFLTNQTLNVMFSTLSFLVFGGVLFVYNTLIFGVFILGSGLHGMWMIRFLCRRKTIDYELFEQQAINQNKTYQFITSMQEIKLQDCELRRRKEWEDVQNALLAVQMKSLKLQQAQEAGSIFINEIKNILITVLAATSVIQGQMTLGMMLAVQYIIGQLSTPVEQLMSFIYSMQDVIISLERINEIHGCQDEESRECQLQSFGEAGKSIRFKAVDFKYYPHSLNYTLKGISFFIPKGKVTAIVGASGSGKTTLIKLMLGFYKASDGTISIAERNISDYNLKWWRRHCGVVMQDGVIFSESIARNIAVSDEEIDSDRLERAARIANIHDYVMHLPLKYNTIIGRDGIGLSQGQKQRVLIARAVYKNPDFIFLDEATNALDAKNERTIVENLNDFYRGRTVVVVAHRLSTVKNADQILVLEAGRIVETGNHTSLIEKQGTYYQLVRNQLELGN